MNKKDFIKIFEDEEDILNSRKIFDLYLKCRDKYYSVNTSFYNPIFLGKIYSYFKYNNDDIQVNVVGGYDEAERCVITFTPNYIEEVNPFSYIKIDINKFQNQLKHRDVLGSVIGLGLTREKIGDIIIKDNYCYVIVLSEIKDFILDNLKYIGRQKISLCEVFNIDHIIKKEKVEKTVTLSSLRIDNFIAKVTNLSRSNVKEIIEQEKVFLNFNVLTNFSKEIQENDIVTIRGYGRFYFKKCTGQSKKGKFVVKYDV